MGWFCLRILNANFRMRLACGSASSWRDACTCAFHKQPPPSTALVCIIYIYFSLWHTLYSHMYIHMHTHTHARTRIHQTVTSSQLQFWQQCKCMPLSPYSHFCLVRSVAARVKFRHFLPNGTELPLIRLCGTFTDSTPPPSPTCGPCIAFMAPNSWPATSSHTTLRKKKHEMWHAKIMSNTTMEGRTATLCNSCGAPYHPAVALQHPAAPMEAPSLERTLTGSTGASAETEARLQGLVRDLFHLADVDSNGTIQFLRQHVRWFLRPGTTWDPWKSWNEAY